MGGVFGGSGSGWVWAAGLMVGLGCDNDDDEDGDDDVVAAAADGVDDDDEEVDGDDDDEDGDDDVESDDWKAVVTVDEPFEGDISEYFMANNEAAADTVLESSPWRHMTRAQLQEELLSDDLLSEMMMLDDQSGEEEEQTPRSGQSTGQRLNGFDRCFRRTKIDRITRLSRESRSGSHLKGVSNADEWKVYRQRELFRLERRLQVRHSMHMKQHSLTQNTHTYICVVVDRTSSTPLRRTRMSTEGTSLVTSCRSPTTASQTTMTTSALQ